MTLIEVADVEGSMEREGAEECTAKDGPTKEGERRREEAGEGAFDREG